MTKLAVAALAATLTAVAGGALASGPVAPPPPYIAPVVPVLYDWSGGYIGLRLAAPMGDNNWDQTLGPTSSLPGDWEGTLYGVTGGYDVQSGSLVFGAALDYTGGTMSATGTTNPGLFTCAGGACTTEVENQLAIRGRIGYAMDRTLIYATGGFATADATGIDGLGNVLGDDRLTGWVAGIGLEHAVSDSFSIGLEYLFTDLGTLDLPNFCGVDCTTDVSYGTIRLGANFRF